MKPLHSTILASIGGGLCASGLMFPSLAFLVPIGAALFFGGLAATVGQVAFPEESFPIRLAFGMLGALALTATGGAAIYYAYALDVFGLSGLCVTLPWVALAFSPLATHGRGHGHSAALDVEGNAPRDPLSSGLLILAVGADVAGLRWLWGARTGEALRTPWEAVSPVFFFWIALATFCLVALAYRRRYPHLTLAAASFHLCTLLAPALAVYAVGYGFDPFVHRAAETLIYSAGEITPKTPYYVGQYALVTVIAHLFHLSVGAVDRFLLPFMTALFLPVSAAWLLRRGYGVPRALAVVGSLGVFFLPLASFIVTTPQGLADLFFLLTILLGAAWLHSRQPPLIFVLLLAIAAAVTHPMAGLPALGAAALLMAAKLRHHGLKTRTFKIAVFLAGCLAVALMVPLAFSLRETPPGHSLAAALRTPIPDLLSGLPFERPGIETRYQLPLDFAEAAARHHPLFLAGLAAIGAALLLRRQGYRRSALATGGLAIALFVSAELLRAGFTFKDVIGYEQANYAERLSHTALLSLAPLVLAGVARWWRALAKADAGVRVFHALFVAALVPALAYAAFPRLDDYRYSRGYSPSIHDLHAVEWIDAHGVPPYVVLANQSVAAAALQRFGFKTYYGSQFYYSIPTGAPLYQAYLDMVYAGPKRETMEAAMRRANVPTAFFVINAYWTNAAAIVAEAKKNADGWQEIDGGKVYVFRYALR